MRWMRMGAGIAVVAVLLTCVGCPRRGRTGPPKELGLENVRMATEGDGKGSTTVYHTTPVFFVAGEVVGAKTDMKVAARLTAIQVVATEVPANHVFGRQEKSVRDGTFVFMFNSPVSAWPRGSYKVDVFLNEELKQTLNFTVE